MATGTKPELALLFEETVALYLRLTAWASTIYRAGELSGPRRTLLVALSRSGPQTVAHLARVRAQARQRLQPLVNALLDEGLVERLENPLHRRSPRIGLTARGQAAARHVIDTENALRATLRLDVSPRSVRAAARVLQKVRAALEAPETTEAVRRTLSKRPKRGNVGS